MARARINGSFTALQVAGGLLSPEFLTKVARLGAPRQQPADYGLVPSLELKEEIGRYWRIGSHWHGRYLRERQRLDRDATKVGIANWLEPFCSELLRYQDLAPTSSRHFDDREFKISHQAWGGSVPFLLLTHDMGLDTPVRSIGMEGLRVAPHALMQEYLNADDDALWGVVANGSRLRILRDNVSLTRAAYLEADLDLMFQDGLYADFAALWLFAHATRLEPVERNPSRCIAEVWRTRALAEGIRVRDQLRGGVQEALSQLGTGLLQHPANQSLRQALASAEVTPQDLLKQLLRLVYRLLFLFTAEDRGLLHAPDADAAAKALYQEGYSLAMLRIRAWRQRHYDRHSDLWRGLQVTFGGLARGAPALALPALGGLFAQEQCALLDGLLLSNRHLLHAVRSLAYFHSGGGFARVNYRDMGTEELGSVYESLLDLYPVIEGHGTGAKLDFVKGDQQKLTGSYYTPPDLANQLIRSVLDPVIARTIQAHPAQPREALLKLTVLDPACGSGHFLLAAARRLATELAKMDSDTGAYDEQTRQHALREVVCHCIYGVDKNDLAVELCKAALWIEAVEPGRPLTFLDHRIRLGDSLVGVVHPELIEDGIPQAAYQGIKGDDKAVCSALKRDNKLQAKGQVLQLGMFEEGTDKTVTADGRLATMGEDTLEEVNRKRQVWDAGEATRARRRYPFDLYAAAFFVPKQRGTEHTVPTTKDLGLVRHKRPMRRAVAEATEQAAQQFQFFHWNVEMEEVMSSGGFDVILANPPWEQIQMSTQEFFASRAPRIAKAPNSATRQRYIEALGQRDASTADKLLHREFEHEVRAIGSSTLFLRKSGRFPLTGKGRINTYAVFAETILDLLKPSGQAGMIVPTGVATDYGTKALFGDIVNQQRIISLYDFENRKKLFAGVHSSYKFSLLTVGGSQNTREVADYAFYLQDVADLAEKERHIPLSKEDFALFNPNTRTCPVFRSRRDLEIARKMYRRAGILWKEAQGQQPEVNPWGIRLYQMFNMASDSNLFQTRQELEGRGFALTGNVFVKEQERYMPLYEAKLFHQYDHRFATFDGVSARDIKNGKARRATAEEKARPDFVPIPRYWVAEEHVAAKLQAYNPVSSLSTHITHMITPPPHISTTQLSPLWPAWRASRCQDDNGGHEREDAGSWDRSGSGTRPFGNDHEYWVGAFRDITSATNLRTTIVALLMGTAANHKAPLFNVDHAGLLEVMCASDGSADWPSMGVTGIENPQRDANEATHDERALKAVASGLVLANLNSIPLDWAARRSVGGTNMSYFILKQLPVLSPQEYLRRHPVSTSTYVQMIMPRVLQLTFTAYDLQSYARNLGFDGPPFTWDTERRHELKCEIDAIYAYMYGLSRADLEWILDAGPPSVSFPTLKRLELQSFGAFQTKRLVLTHFDRLTEER